MPTYPVLLTASDFTHFPDLFNGHIDAVLSELNTTLIEEARKISPQPDLASPASHKPGFPAENESIEILRTDMLNNPYLYLSDELINKIR